MSRYILSGVPEDRQHNFNILYVADKVIQKWHEGQVDKAGEDYINHLYRVADKVAQHPKATTMTVLLALLHDIVEDTAITYKDFHRAFSYAGFTHEVSDLWYLIENLTREENKTDLLYYTNVARDRDSLIVKIADMEDNLDEDRLKKLPKDVQERLKTKYSLWYLALKQEESKIK